MTIYNGLFEPKKSAIKDCGAVQLAIAVEAPNKKVAESIITGKLWESYPANGDNYFKPKLWEHEEGQPLPTVGQFDELFAQQHTFDGEKWVSIAANGTAGEESNLPAGDDVIDLMTVSPGERFAAVLLFSTAAIDGHLYSQVVDYLDNLNNRDTELEEEDRFNLNVLCALHNNEPVKHMHVEGLNNLIQGIFSHFENQTPGKAAISQFVKRWLENPGKREEMVPGQNSSLGAASTDTNVKIAPKRGYKHTYATLDQEIAVALLPISPDAPVLSGNLRDAEKIIADEREDFKRWSMALRTTEHIFKYDRDSIFGVVQNVPAKDTYHFPDSLRRHIDSWLEANGRFEETETGSVKQPEATQNTASNVGEKEEVPPSVVTDTQAKQARETLNDMGYGVYASGEGAEPEEKLSVKAEKLADDSERLAKQIAHAESLPNAEDVVQAVGKPIIGEDNLDLWKRVFKTDERFTKAFTQNGGGTSINGTYMTMLATREFGPKGIGWGVDIVEERFDIGAPITRQVKGKDNNASWELVLDGNGNTVNEQHHVVTVRLWYILNGVRGEETAYGCTPYIYGSKYGITCDGEAAKKSLTDATKKALSGLGFSGDIFMGLYDNLEYRQKNKAEFDLKNASESAEDAARLRQEFDDKLSRVANTLAHGVTVNEINGVFSPIAREIDVHIKAAQANGDTQHERYLSGRLRRLISIKDGRIKELNKAEEKA
ncbi:hypothetical protein JKF61_01395 [Klebsiella quasipneumoniae]|uniref:hypothetical protein n=1 Tax=Klebsiella pneumoniae complex TaxID=3390273 RepID=UPI0021CAFFFC|nr:MULTISPECIES: hypothetical protein [Klebsiella]HBS0997694.1 hypothetical protein [Klebsiella quasipneumoniae subsp. similipneumoniae]HDE2519146.1 hypothetical protein [Klebsiella pneumoniae]MCU4141129.1 hypothetical protein [Klebsiella quasipneumoniae]MCU4151724.1 hypothetical protein [Klebsiella quasipneumoniae]MEA5437394.1 hypothetical protein [Klebsiella variicola]